MLKTDLGVEFDAEGLMERWPTLSVKEKREALLVLRAANRESKAAPEEDRQIGVPQTDDELHQWIIENTGIDVPRVAVCPDHKAPFDFIADAYFNRSRAILVLGSREGGKSLGGAILHFANAETKPEIEACTFGAIEAQAKRVYKHVKSFIYTYDSEGKRVLKPQIDGDPKRSETAWKNGALIEIIVGTKSGVNSPHPNVVHADELDLMDDDVWQESRNMSSSSVNREGQRIPALDIATSTRKSMKGLMQQLINETEQAIKSGHKPAWDFHAFCIFEVAQEVPNCRQAPKEEREARLSELGRDPCELCACHLQVKGEWTEKNPRTLESVCRGRFFRSRGWMDHEDVVGKFMQNTQVVWEAQQECRRPEAEGLYLPTWTRQRFTVRNWVPRPEYGFLWVGVDWGGSENSCFPGSVACTGPEPEGVTRRPYSGELVEIVISPGDILPVTPNHPILTNRGWIPAKEICAGDYLFRDSGHQRTLSGVVHDEQQVRAFQYLFDSQQVLDSLNMDRCLVGPLDFHGDVSGQSYVDVVDINGNLRNDYFAQVGEPSTDELLIFGNPSSTLGSTFSHPQQLFSTSFDSLARIGVGAMSSSHGSDFFRGHVRESQAHFFSSGTQRNAELNQLLLHRLAIDADHVGQFGCGLASQIAPSELVQVVDGHGGVVTERQPVLDKAACERLLADSNLVGQRLDGFTGQVTAVQVREVRNRQFVGHVYNAQTPQGWYLANGFIASNCVLWIQGPLHESMQAVGFDHPMVVIPKGAYVIFKEIAIAGIGATKLADMVVRQEIQYRNEFPGWRVKARFADMAGRQQRDDWREHNPPLRTVWYVSRDFEPTVETLQGLAADGLLWVDVANCASMVDDFESWRQEKGKEVHDASSHGPAAARYCLTNVKVIMRRYEREEGSVQAAQPVVAQRSGSLDPTGAMAIGAVGSGAYETERWREAFGMSSGPGRPGPHGY